MWYHKKFLPDESSLFSKVKIYVKMIANKRSKYSGEKEVCSQWPKLILVNKGSTDAVKNVHTHIYLYNMWWLSFSSLIFWDLTAFSKILWKIRCPISWLFFHFHLIWDLWLEKLNCEFYFIPVSLKLNHYKTTFHAKKEFGIENNY